jgi:hypothetical protein
MELQLSPTVLTSHELTARAVTLWFGVNASSLGTTLVFFPLRGWGGFCFSPVLNLFLGRFADVAQARQAFRIIANQKLDESFAHLTTKIGKLLTSARTSIVVCFVSVTCNPHTFLSHWIVFDEPL